MGLALTYIIKFFSQYSKDIPITNGVETQMSQLDMSKWIHFPTRDKFIFQLYYHDDAQLIMTVLGNDVHVIEQFSVSKQDIELKRVSHIQFSIKSPTISCKYLKLSNNLLVQRRFQMTLENKQDFDNLVHLFAQVNIAVKNAKVLNDNTLIASQIPSKPFVHQLPLMMDKQMNTKTGSSTGEDDNTTLLETQIGEPVNLNLSNSSFTRDDTFCPSWTHKGDKFQVPNRSIPIETGYQNENIIRQIQRYPPPDNIVRSIPNSINIDNNTSNKLAPILPQLKQQSQMIGRGNEVIDTRLNQARPTQLGKISTTEKESSISYTTEKIFPSVNSYMEPITTSNTTCRDEKIYDKTRPEDQNTMPSTQKAATNIIGSNSKRYKVDYPSAPLNNDHTLMVETQLSKETTQVNKPSDQVCNHISSKESTTQSDEGGETFKKTSNKQPSTQIEEGKHSKKKSKKKIHITRKLIRAKLKDKKFRKWVCNKRIVQWFSRT